MCARRLLSQFYYLLMTITLNIVRRSSDKKNYYIFMDGIQLSFLLSLHSRLLFIRQTTHTSVSVVFPVSVSVGVCA